MLTASRLREVLSYDPLTGIMRWKVAPTTSVRAGDIAGCKNSAGRLVVGIDGRLYLVHRLAVLYMTGSWPAAGVAHEDRNCTNNRWDNLEIGRRERQPAAVVRVIDMLTKPKPRPVPQAPTLWTCWRREAEAEMA